MTKHAIGDVVIANGWPAVVLEANRSEAPNTAVLCAVFGWEIDYGSVYLKDISPSTYKEAYFQVSDDKREDFNQAVEKYRKEGEKKRATAARRKAKKEGK